MYPAGQLDAFMTEYDRRVRRCAYWRSDFTTPSGGLRNSIPHCLLCVCATTIRKRRTDLSGSVRYTETGPRSLLSAAGSVVWRRSSPR